MDSTFIYAMNTDTDEPIMLIDKNIGIDETGQGIAGDIFQRELLMLDEMDKKRIQVWINSPGGYVSDGWAIYNSILKTKTPVDTYCFGMAASIAGVIFQAGRKRIMADYGILMYHDPSGSDDKKSLNATRDSIIKMICTRSGMNETDCSDMMERTTFINADEAKEMGLCDEVEVTEELNMKRVKRVTDLAMYHSECSKIVNSLKLNTTNMTTTKIKMLLGLNDTATEANVVSAISDLKKKKSDLEDDVEDFKKKKSDLEDELDKVKKKKAALEDELDKLKKKMKSMEDDADDDLEDRATRMVEDYAKKGRIKNEKASIEKWTKHAIKNFKEAGNFNEVKAMIDDLPINKPSVTVETNNTANAAPTTAVGLSAKLTNKLRSEGRKI